MTTHSTAPQLDTEARNRAIQELRRSLVQFGRAFDLLHGAECDCEDPRCANRNPETMTAERLLDDPHPEPGDDGLGLQLMIARAIAAAHGGHLTARSRGGDVIELDLQLPARPASDA